MNTQCQFSILYMTAFTQTHWDVRMLAEQTYNNGEFKHLGRTLVVVCRSAI